MLIYNLCGLIERTGTRTCCHLPEWEEKKTTLYYIITTQDCANAITSCQTYDEHPLKETGPKEEGKKE